MSGSEKLSDTPRSNYLNNNIRVTISGGITTITRMMVKLLIQCQEETVN
jgi:hypothetical protein